MDNIKSNKILFDYKTTNYRSILIYISIGLIFFVIVFLFLFKKETFIEASGIIKQNNISQSFSSTSNNPIESIFIKNDNQVKKNQKILSFDTQDIELQLASSEDNKQKLEQKLIYIQKYKDSINSETNLIENNNFGYLNNYQSLIATIDNIKLEIEALDREKNDLQVEKRNKNKDKDDINLKMEDLQVYKTLVNNGDIGTFKTDEIRNKAIAYLNIEEKNNDIKITTLSEISDLNTVYSQTNTDLKESLKQINENLNLNETNHKTKLNLITNTLDSKLSELELESDTIATEIHTKQLEIDQQKLEIQDSTIKADFPGIVEFDSAPKVGDVIATGTTIGKIINKSSKDMTIELYIPSNLISEIKKGQKVKFKIDTQNGKKNSIIYAKIDQISIQPTASENTEDSQNYFIITCKMETNENKYIHGLVGNGNIITGEVNYIQYILNKLF